MYNWEEEIKGYFERKDSEKFGDGIAASRLNREIEDFLLEKAIPAIQGLKEEFLSRNRFLHIDKNKQAVSAAVRFGNITEFVYEIHVRKLGEKAVAIRVANGGESILAPQASMNDNSINSLTIDDIRRSFVFEYIAAMG